MSECQREHNFIQIEEGYEVCSRCGAKGKQMLANIKINASKSAAVPVTREKVKVPFYNGSEVVRIERYKDDVMKELYKDLYQSIGINAAFESR